MLKTKHPTHSAPLRIIACRTLESECCGSAGRCHLLHLGAVTVTQRELAYASSGIWTMSWVAVVKSWENLREGRHQAAHVLGACGQHAKTNEKTETTQSIMNLTTLPPAFLNCHDNSVHRRIIHFCAQNHDDVQPAPSLWEHQIRGSQSNTSPSVFLTSIYLFFDVVERSTMVCTLQENTPNILQYCKFRALF